MRQLLIYIMLLMPALALAQSSYELEPGYPVEVMGVKTTTVAGPMPPGEAGPFMFFKIHSVSFPQELQYNQAKVSIRLSAGEWVDVTNANAVCPGRESKYECVEGPLATVRFAVPSAILGNIAASDTIYYRFNFVEGDASSGYRVLAASKSLFDELAQDFTPPADSTITEDSTDVVIDPPPVEELLTGEELFKLRNSLIDFPGGPVIKAACNDCHAENGRDLVYFGFSEHSIEVRSRFHGLTQEEAERIAEFVYSVQDTPVGTPWDPPYQPGEGINPEDAYEWSAGAGLESVLEHDSLNALPIEAIQLDGSFNRTVEPITLELPDWNEWLPVFHPSEAWNGDFFASEPYTRYVALKDNLESPGYISGAIQSGSIIRAFEDWFNSVRDAERSDATFIEMPFEDKGKRDYSLYQWHLVKAWDLLTEYDLQTIAVDLYPDGDSLAWFSNARSPFNLGPHIHGPSKGPNGTLYNTFFDTGWYELQLIVNSGNHTTTSLKPVDWKYHFSHIRDFDGVAGTYQANRFMMGYLEVLQAGARLEPRAINPRHFWINRIVQLSGGSSGRAGGCGKNPFCEMAESDRRAYANAFLSQFLLYLERHPVSSWDGVLEGSEETPMCEGNAYTEKNMAHATMCVVQSWDGFADDALIERLKAWSREKWPAGAW